MSDLSFLDSPIGRLGIQTDNDYLVSITFLPKSTKALAPASSLAKEVQQQLLAYFKNKLTQFNLPLATSGSPFQQKVLDALNKIPYGETVTYSNLANTLVSGPRAVGNACRRNPFPIIIPCHRVVSKNGLGGYSGATSGNLLSIKSWLLNHEASIK